MTGQISVTVATTQVELAGGQGAVTVSVTNGRPEPERLVLGAFSGAATTPGLPAPDPASWATIERPLREVASGATEQYTATFDAAGAPAGTYEVKFIAYPADEAPEEHADQGQVVRLVVPPSESSPPPPRRPWWVLAVVAALAVIAVVVFLLTRSGPDPLPTPSPTPPATLDPVGSWGLTSGTGPDGAIPLVEGVPITLTVVESGEFNGSSGCNTYFGTLTVDGTAIAFGDIATTLRLCIFEPITVMERAYLDALGAVDAGSREANTLTLTGEGVELRFALSGPTVEPPALPGGELQGEGQ